MTSCLKWEAETSCISEVGLSHTQTGHSATAAWVWEVLRLLLLKGSTQSAHPSTALESDEQAPHYFHLQPADLSFRTSKIRARHKQQSPANNPWLCWSCPSISIRGMPTVCCEERKTNIRIHFICKSLHRYKKSRNGKAKRLLKAVFTFSPCWQI